ncbi:MAG: hypothetical protein H5T34_01630 [Candidatus Methanomethyliales bacterium]|nr:hypothetical protein [Candidatus Methanomethylicales archaeon]
MPNNDNDNEKNPFWEEALMNDRPEVKPFGPDSANADVGVKPPADIKSFADLTLRPMDILNNRAGVLMCKSTLHALKKTILDILGPAGAELIRYAGSQCGAGQCHTLLAAYGPSNKSRVLELYCGLLYEWGWGDVWVHFDFKGGEDQATIKRAGSQGGSTRDRDQDQDEDEDRAPLALRALSSISIRDSFEARLSTGPGASEPSCHLLGGMLEGFISALFGKKVRLKEVECASLGTGRCLFVPVK